MSLKAETLAHYDRMIAWVNKRWFKFCKQDSYKMMKEINEDWFSTRCPLCKNYLYKNCFECPVFKKTNEKSCSNTPWIKMNNSRTWINWLKYAKQEREFLESLDYGE